MRKPRPEKTPIDTKRLQSWISDFGAYRHAVTRASIEDWLDQFKKRDHDLAARVLDAVEFYGNDRIGVAFRKSLQAIPGWDKRPSARQGRWRFVAYSASSGESGGSMLYQFRLANRLDGKTHNQMFIYPSQLVLQRLGPDDTVVLVDDFVGTGDQVCEAWNESFAELVAGAGRVYLVVIGAVTGARRRVREETEVRLVPSHEFNEADNLFSDRCTRFPKREKGRLLAYNKRADKRHPRGYGDCGLIVVFQHRCPNNSVPMLHANHSRWTGLFPRHD